MPPLPAEKLCPSPAAIQLETHCNKAVGCSPGTFCRASAVEHASSGQLCGVRPCVLDHEGAAMAVKETEDQLLDKAASLGSSIGRLHSAGGEQPP